MVTDSCSKQIKPVNKSRLRSNQPETEVNTSFVMTNQSLEICNKFYYFGIVSSPETKTKQKSTRKLVMKMFECPQPQKKKGSALDCFNVIWFE